MTNLRYFTFCSNLIEDGFKLSEAAVISFLWHRCKRLGHPVTASTSYIGKTTGLKKNCILAAIKTAEARGYVKVDRALHKTNRYWVDLSEKYDGIPCTTVSKRDRSPEETGDRYPKDTNQVSKMDQIGIQNGPFEYKRKQQNGNAALAAAFPDSRSPSPDTPARSEKEIQDLRKRFGI